MMKAAHTFHVDGTSKEDVMTYLQSPKHLNDLITHLEAVSHIEEVSRQQDPTRVHLTQRVLRYQAPTASKVPGFLKRYRDKAPEHVYWKEFGTWDASEHTLRYRIEAEIPEDWQRYYDAKGSVTLEDASGGGVRITTALEAKVNVFGLGKAIEMASKKEVERILAQQAQATLDHFS